ncbi:MAG: hypothetical protein B0W54_13410 [Cellvibrio sp. 79]|nr:MAG: hypothetical protein B0W54_13410 [Cellvibrio sp. 79]
MEVTHPNTPLTQSWYLKLIPSALILLAACLYFETTNALFIRWVKWDESLSHGLIIIGLFFYFLLISSPINAQKDSFIIRSLGLIALGGSSLAWYFSNLINLQIIEQLSLLSIMIFLFMAAFGLQALKRHISLFLLLIFTIPIWDQLTDPLVNLSGLIVGKLVRLIGLPAVIDSNSIFIPFGEIVIADGCSGLRYLTISLAIAYIISYLNGYSLKRLLLALIIATVIGLAANWLRIFILVIVGYESQMQSSLMSDHEYFGWVLFAIILFPAIYFAPVVKPSSAPGSEHKSKPKLVTAIILLSLGPVLNNFLIVTPVVAPIANEIPHEYSPVPENRMPVKVELPPADKTESAVDQHQVYIQINHFQRKTDDEKLVPYIPRLYDHVTWSLISQTKANDNSGLNIQIFRNKHSGAIIAQSQWFNVAKMQTNNYAIAKFLQIPAIISGKNNFTIYTLQSICTTSNCSNEISNIQNLSKILIATNN